MNPLTSKNDQLSILFVTLSLARGGTERHLAEVVPRLAARGWLVTIFCLTGRGDFATAVAAEGIEVIGTAPSGEGKDDWLPAPLRFLMAAVKLAATMVWRRPAIVHCFLPAPYLVGGPLAWLTHRPVRLMSRRSQNHYMTRHPWAGRMERWLHWRMTGILANSHKLLKELIEDEGADANRVGLIYNGVDLLKFAKLTDRAAVRAKLDLGAATFVAVMVANLIAYKGHADLIEALARISSKLPAGWLVLLAGRDEGTGTVLADLTRAKGIENNVRFLGARTDVEDLLQACDIGLLCSHEEGFSNAVIEGMAAGLAMVVTDVGGNSEAVRHGIEGLVVPRGDVDAIAQAILDLAGDMELRTKMGAAGRKRANSEFSIEACVDRYEAVYSGLAAGKRLCDITPHGCPHAVPGG